MPAEGSWIPWRERISLSFSRPSTPNLFGARVALQAVIPISFSLTIGMVHDEDGKAGEVNSAAGKTPEGNVILKLSEGSYEAGGGQWRGRSCDGSLQLADLVLGSKMPVPNANPTSRTLP